jgi:hypothetical protein
MKGKLRGARSIRAVSMLVLAVLALTLASCGRRVAAVVAPGLDARTYIAPDGAYALDLDPSISLTTDKKVLDSLLKLTGLSSSVPTSLDAASLGDDFELKIMRMNLGSAAPGWGKMSPAERIEGVKAVFQTQQGFDLSSLKTIDAADGNKLLFADSAPLAAQKGAKISFLVGVSGDWVVYIILNDGKGKSGAAPFATFAAKASSLVTSPAAVAEAGKRKAAQDEAERAAPKGKEAGFYAGFPNGFVHGLLIPLRWLCNKILKTHYEMTARLNIGFFYWLGFVLGIIMMVSTALGGAGRRR